MEAISLRKKLDTFVNTPYKPSILICRNVLDLFNCKQVHLNKFLMISFLSLFLITTHATPNQKLYKKDNFDNNWRFSLSNDENAKQEQYDDLAWETLDLPHDWSISTSIDSMSQTGNDGGYFGAGVGWYRKKFTISSFYKNNISYIFFEGIYMNSEVYLNGHLLGIHPYGYTSFYYNLTPYLHFGKENVISVKVDNSKQKNSRWYSGSGIYRHVWLITKPQLHIANRGVFIRTQQKKSGKVSVLLDITIENESKSSQSFNLCSQVFKTNSIIAKTQTSNIKLQSKEKKVIIQEVSIANPLLWDPNSPALYNAIVTLYKNRKIIDRQNQNTFGIRSIKFSATTGFELNGKEIKLDGGCVHHDNGCLGSAAYNRAEERKAELLKKAGFNAVRTSHNPPSEAFLNACDKLGLMVVEESFDGWREAKNTHDYSQYFDQWWQSDIKTMVEQDRNHPSVIMWSSGNEIIERTKPEAIETAHKLNQYIRELDPTRPVTSAMTTWNQGWEIFDSLFAQHDIGGYNYQLQHATLDHIRVPERIIMQTESYPKDAFTNYKLVKDNKYIIGDFVWTALDYLGESGIGRNVYPGEKKGEHYEKNMYPWHGAYCGDIDITGYRKVISHYRNLLWNEKEKLYLAVKEPNPKDGKIDLTLWSVWPTWESWSWPGHEGKKLEVEVYSKYPKVRLYLNNNLIGEDSTTEQNEFKATFPILYSPGTLKAVGFVDNKEIESKILHTVEKTETIKLIPDRTSLSANGQDLSFIEVELCNKNGIINPNADNQLQFSISGSGVIAGVANANMKDNDKYVGNERKAWHGRALVVIKSLKKVGKIELKVRSNHLPEQSLTLQTH